MLIIYYIQIQFPFYLQGLRKGLKKTQDVSHLFPLHHDQWWCAGCVISFYASLG